jgi:hypothetical protein
MRNGHEWIVEPYAAGLDPVGSPTTTKRSPRAIEPGGLIFGLIHLRSSTFIGIRINPAMQVADVSGIRRTTVLTPENRKVGNGD